MKKTFHYYIEKPILRTIIIGIVFSLLIVAVLCEIGISLSGAKQSMVYIHDIFFAALWLYLFFNMSRRKNNIENKYTGEEKTLGFLAIAFGGYFLAVIIIKILMGKPIDDSTILLRPLLWSCALYIFLSKNKKIANKLIITLAILFSLLNLFMIFNMCFLTESIRKIKVLGNINTAMNVQLLSVIFWYVFIRYTEVKNKRKSIIIKSLAVFNSLFAVFTAIGSGTRLFLPLTFVLMLVLILFNRDKICTKLKRIVFLLVSVVLIFLALLNFNILDSTYNVYRTFSYVNSDVISVFKFTKSNSGTTGQEANEFKEIEIENAENSIELSNDMRGALWVKSLELISEDFLIGRGDITVEVEMLDDNAEEGYRLIKQAPHNFILEVLLSVGALGLILYMLLIFTPLIYAFTANTNMIVKINLAVIYIAIMIPSLFQPLITTKLILGIGLWVMLAVVKNMIEYKEALNEGD